MTTNTNRRTRKERIALKREQIRQWENEVKRLLNEEKEAERKARTSRLCKRAGFLESILPDTIMLNEKSFETFVKNHIANKYGLSAINRLIVEQEKDNAKTIAAESEQAKTETPLKPKPSAIIEDDDGDESEYGD